jgi:hypothetical protein
LNSIDLKAVGGGHYEAVYDKFNLFGIYHIAVFAIDANGSISMLKTTTVEQTVGPDGYEVDNSSAQANGIYLNSGVPQRHNFHFAEDRDWVKFDAVKDQVLEIKVSRVGSDADVVIELFDSDGTTPMKPPWSWEGAGGDEAITWVPPKNGLYYVKTSLKDGYFPGDDTGYDLDIYSPIGAFLLVEVTHYFEGVPIPKVEITTALLQPDQYFTDSNGHFGINHQYGWWTVSAKKKGYMKESVRVYIPQYDSTTVEFSLKPILLHGPLLLLLLP